MTAFEVAPLSHLSSWGLISRTFSTLKNRPLFFFSLTIMTMLPELLGWWRNMIANEVFYSILGSVLASAIAYGVFNDLKEDNPVPLGLTVSHALRWPLVGFALMCALFSILGQVWVELISPYGW